MRRLMVLCAVLCALVLEGGHVTAASDDVVLYASDVSTIQGNWARVPTTGAAGGQSLASVKYGWSAPNAPLAAPNDYFEATFTATANRPYHVWLRLRASGDSTSSDSVWVQFGDAINASGAPVYSIGSTSGLLVNLEDCNHCGVAGWGWQDTAYWVTQSFIVRFPSSGAHTIRIQTRQDGVQIDQIVLSPSTYLTNYLGQLKNDTTIVPKPPVISSPTPYAGAPAAIPGTIQNEDFDNGGADVAYYDSTPGNAGGQYRQTDVDIEATGDGTGYNVGWVTAGEWLKYTVAVASAGPYTIAFRLASPGLGGTFHLEMNGTNVTGPVQVPDTGGWQNWQTVSMTATLTAGVQVARLVMDTPGGLNVFVGNFDWMQFSQGGGGSAPGAPTAPNPPAGAFGVPTTPSLGWSAPGATLYDVRLGLTNPPTTTVASNTPSSSYAPSALNGGTTYYWQVVAKNSWGSTTGAVWNFMTATVTSDPPGRVVFQKSADDATGVTSYLLEIFSSVANPAVDIPLASSDLGKPAAAANGDITVDRLTFFSALLPGTYLATVSAIGPAGRARSTPLAFSR